MVGIQLQIQKELSDTEKALENCGDDYDLMQECIENLTKLQNKVHSTFEEITSNKYNPSSHLTK